MIVSLRIWVEGGSEMAKKKVKVKRPKKSMGPVVSGKRKK